ncbi:MAG: hypothetical protein ACRDY2_11065, partial [Acidimicrobiales bacterium]
VEPRYTRFNYPSSELPAPEALVGEVLLAVVRVARQLGVDPEGALRRAVAEYRRRFNASFA